MQTFTVKIAGDILTEKDIRTAIWQCTELSESEIIVTEE